MIIPKLLYGLYTCGPLEGRNNKEAFSWRDTTTKYLAHYGIKVYNPGWDTTLNDPDTITMMDFLMIDNSEVLLCNLTCLGEDRPTNTGTLIEIGYARKAGKLMVGFSYVDWQRENRFLRGVVKPIFFNSFGANEDPLFGALKYISGFNNRKRTNFEV